MELLVFLLVQFSNWLIALADENSFRAGLAQDGARLLPGVAKKFTAFAYLNFLYVVKVMSIVVCHNMILSKRRLVYF